MRGGGGWRGGNGGGWGDRQQQAVEAAPPVQLGPPVKFELTGKDVWQAHMGNHQWQDVDETWAERLNQALRDGASTITLEHVYRNRYGEEVHSRYEIDFTGARDGTGITQLNCGSGTVRQMRVIELMAPNSANSPQQVPMMAASLASLALSPPPAAAGSADHDVPMIG